MFNLGMESDAVKARTLGVHRNACYADAKYMVSQEIKRSSNKRYWIVIWGCVKGETCFWKSNFSISLPSKQLQLSSAVLKEIHCIEERRFLFYILLVPLMLPLSLPPPAPHGYFTASWWRESSSEHSRCRKCQPDEPRSRQLAWVGDKETAQEKHRNGALKHSATAVRKSWMKEEK